MRKKQSTLTSKVVIVWMVVMVISNVFVGVVSYTMYRNQLFEARAIESQNVALAMAVRIDGDKFNEIMLTLEKNDYWYEVKNYADAVAKVFDTAYIYIIDKNYTDEVTYFAEGAIDDAPFDLGTTEIIEGVYADEMFETLLTGVPTHTEPYPSGEYGEMVSGFAAITDSSGRVAGVVGVDFFYEGIQESLRSFAFSLFIIIAVFLTGCYFLMNYLGTKLAGKPLSKLDEYARQFAIGDTEIKIDIKSQTEIGRLAESFTRMIEGVKTQVAALEVLSRGDLTPEVRARSEKDIMGIAISKILENLNGMFREIKRASAGVSEGARQISDSAQLLAQGSGEQAGAVERLSSSIADVTKKANENLGIAAKTDRLASEIKSDAQIGSDNMNRMITAVKEITEASAAISKVIKVIDDIAFQTNILALNAAVEAARAGQLGKGFAVVAEEVRNLASKSTEAAKDSERLIKNSMEKAQSGELIAGETMASLERIIMGINECAESVSVISDSFNEQITFMTEFNRDIEQVSQIVAQNNSTAEESAAASEQMKEQANVLDELVSHFKLDD